MSMSLVTLFYSLAVQFFSNNNLMCIFKSVLLYESAIIFFFCTLFLLNVSNLQEPFPVVLKIILYSKEIIVMD